MRHVPRLMIVWAALVLVLAGSLHAQDEVSNLRYAACETSAPYSYDMDCGYLSVPENYADPDSEMIDMAFAIIHTRSDDPEPDPIVYLVGGPGGSIIGRAANSFANNFRELAEKRDIILVDQRGTGFSRPQLFCDEFLMNFKDVMFGGREADDEADFLLDLYDDCHDRLTAGGVDLSMYNSANIAADLDSLREALGIDQWNLYGVSYGSRLALTLMRDYPQHIRSVILDSVVPLQGNLYLEIMDHITRAQGVLFEGCAIDPDCNEAYPDLETVFWELYERLNADPIVLNVTFQQVGNFDVYITGNRLVAWVFGWSYAVGDIVHIPRFLYAIYEDDGSQGRDFQQAINAGLNSELSVFFISMAMHYSVQCNEEIAFTDSADFDVMFETYPQFTDYMTYSSEIGDSLLALCGNWTTVEPNPVENEAVVSDIPTLVLAGQYDPVTPPRWARLAAETLENSYFYEAPGIGHGVIRSSACGMSIAASFMDDPFNEPDSSCLDDMGGPDFVVR